MQTIQDNNKINNLYSKLVELAFNIVSKAGIDGAILYLKSYDKNYSENEYKIFDFILKKVCNIYKVNVQDVFDFTRKSTNKKQARLLVTCLLLRIGYSEFQILSLMKFSRQTFSIYEIEIKDYFTNELINPVFLKNYNILKDDIIKTYKINII